MAERITGHTELIGIIANPIKHSLSPAMHNEAFAKLGLDYAYMAFEVAHSDLEDAIKSIRVLNMAGCNISMPYKSEVIRYLDELSPEAKLCGAVNTIVNKNGILKGYITDGTGFMMSLKDNGIDAVGKKITIAGCGGAATAVEIQAALDGVKEISIFNRRNGSFWDNGLDTVDKIHEHTAAKAALYDLEDHKLLKKEIEESDILINATGVGMKPLEGKTWLPDASYLRKELVVCDTIYSPGKTKLLETAETVGCRTINGEGMILFQGAACFKLWTGKDMPVDHIKKTVGLCL